MYFLFVLMLLSSLSLLSLSLSVDSSSDSIPPAQRANWSKRWIKEASESNAGNGAMCVNGALEDIKLWTHESLLRKTACVCVLLWARL